MAGKSNLSATLFAQKKLLGKANTSVVKSDSQEVIGSNIQVAAQTIFSEDIPGNPVQTLYLLQSASHGGPATVEYVQFDLESISGTTYDANTYDDDSKIGNPQDAGPHAYKLKLSASYESLSSNTNKGNGTYDNGKTLFETIGGLQIVPPNFSGNSPNPYILKLYKGNPSNVSNEIPLLDEIDWTIDYYNGILFLQDYDDTKIPLYARGFIYTGKMLSASLGDGGGGSGDITAVIAGSGLSGGANTGAATLNIGAGTGITVNANDIAINNSIVATLTGSTFSGTVKAPALSGSLTKLSDGSSYLIAGSNITITTGSNGAVTIAGTGGTIDGSGAANRIATWADSDTLTSDSDLTWDGTTLYASSGGTTLNIQGDTNLNGTVVINQSGVNKDFRVETQNKSSALQVDGGTDQVLLFSGSLSDAAGHGSSASDPDPRAFIDTNFFVSGSIGSRGTSRRGTSVFGGDLFVSGTIHGISTQHVLVADDSSLDNARVLTAGSGITITTSSPREITVSSTGLVSRSKIYTDITASHAANQPLNIHTADFSTLDYSSDRIDVFLNGLLLRSGSSHDYELAITGSILFKTSLESADTVLVITF